MKMFKCGEIIHIKNESHHLHSFVLKLLHLCGQYKKIERSTKKKMSV